MADATPKSYHTDPALYLYTSLTAGSSHIITATSRLETILKANRIPFTALDVATDEKARMLWGRRAGKRKLPGLVRMGMLIGDLEEIEEWNEYGELKERVGVKPMPMTPSAANTPTKVPSASTPSAMSTSNSPSKMISSSTETPSRQMSSSSANTDSPMSTALRQAAMEAAKKAGDAKAKAAGRASASSSISKETQEKLDSAGPTGMPPPSGTTDAEAAKEADMANARVESKADAVPTDSPSEKEMLEGVGESNEREPEATKDTPASAQDTSPKDPDIEAIVPESKNTTPTQAIHFSHTKATKGQDPDTEAVVPGSEDTASSKKTKLAITDTSAQLSTSSGPTPDTKDFASPPTTHSGIKDTERGDHHDAKAMIPGSEDKTTSKKTGKDILDTEKKQIPHNDNDNYEQVAEKEKGKGRNVVESTREMTATDGAEDLPGRRTQEQGGAEAEEAGVSVGD